MAKKTRGRQKIPITKITHRSNLQVTFSKRRTGLFKKASELSTLCGADVALIVFSPAEKVFSYGNPSVDNVVDRFLEGTNNSATPPQQMMMMQLMREEQDNVQNMQLDHILGLLEEERRRGEEINREMEAFSHEWWRGPVSEFTLEQLEALRDKLLGLKGNIVSQLERVIVEMANQPQPPPVQYFAGPGSSYYGAAGSSAGFDGFADPGPSAQALVPQPYNMGYEQHHHHHHQGFY